MARSVPGPAASLTVPSPTPTVTGPVVVPLPPFAHSCPLTCRLKIPGSLAGTVTFRSSSVAVQRVELLSALTVFVPSVQVSVVAPANAVWKAPVTVPGWKTSGWPRFTGAGANPLVAPTGIVTGKLFGFE